MTVFYQEDSVTLDAERITEEKHPLFGDMTVFHGVVIASEIVQKYGDGQAYKPRSELEAYTPTVDGRWVLTGGHPGDGIISQRDQIHGRTINPRYVKNLIDHKSGRPNRAGVRADVQIFNNKVPPKTLKDMKNGAKRDVSIGFFFSKDSTSGVVEDGPFKGTTYDYVQTNMFHDHLAAGIDKGRCPSPYCGLGADELKSLTGDPFAGFLNWGDCTRSLMKNNPEMSHESAIKICGSLKAKHEDAIEEDKMQNIKALAKAILDFFAEEEAVSVTVDGKAKPISMDDFVKEYTMEKTATKIDEKIKELLDDL